MFSHLLAQPQGSPSERMRRPFRTADFAALRTRNRAIVGVTLTDRCPVGCAHCSVAATNHDGAPGDERPFLAWVSELAARAEVEAVVVTGGEPFLHPTLLASVADTIVAAGRRAVV